jgi:RNA polymerase sigma-70 factor (ECF subfamily)
LAKQSRPSSSRSADDPLSEDLDRARAGDDAAFVRVFRAVQPGLLRYLGALVGQDAEDVASEAWAHACRDLGKFRGDIDGFRGWLATIARRRAIDHLRAKGRRPADPAPIEDLLDADAGLATDGDALDSIATGEAIAMICTLPKDQAEAVLLRVVVGLDAKAAGRVLGKRSGAVRAAAFRGLQSLATMLDTDASARNKPAIHGDDTMRWL